MAEGGAPRKDTKEQGSNWLHKKNQDGNTPLHVAARAGNADVIRALLEIEMDTLEERNLLGQTPLYLAVLSGKEEAVECLLEAGADLATRADDDSTIWHAAASTGCLELMKMVIAMALKTNNIDREIVSKLRTDTETKLCQGTSPKLKPNTFALKDKGELFDTAKSITSHANDPIQALTDQNGQDKVKKDKKFNNEIALDKERKHLESDKKNKKMDNNGSPNNSKVKQASEKNIKQSKIKNEKLHTEKQSFEIGSDADQFIEMCKDFLKTHLNGPYREIKADNSCGNEFDLTLLHAAAMSGAEEYIENMLKYVTDVNVKAKTGVTPLLLAVESGSERLIDMLINAGADYMIQDDIGETTLHVAVRGKNLPVVKKLLALGLDPNKQTKYGNTALHFAAMEAGNAPTVKELLKHRANKNIKNSSGLTPYLYAIETKDIGLVRALS